MNKKGFTLIEFAIVIVITAIIAGILSILIREVASTYTFIRVRGVALADNRLAMDRMTREIRQIKSATSLYTATDNELRFRKVGEEMVRFVLEGNLLKRKDGTDDILASNVILPDHPDDYIFTYYDVNNNKLTAPITEPAETDLWRIKINLTITKGDETVRFQSQVHPRNLQ